LYKGICDFKKGYQTITNIVKHGKGDLGADCHTILARWRDHFSQVLNIRGVNDVRHTELNTAEPVGSEPSAYEVEMAIAKLKSKKSRCFDQISEELIKTWAVQFAIRPRNSIFLFGIRRNCLRSGRSRSFYLAIRMAIKRAYYFCQLRTKYYPTPYCQG